MNFIKDLRILPKFRESLSYLYIEHCKVEKDSNAIALFDTEGKTPIPCANLSMLMLGPGTSITHAAIRVLAKNGCLVIWCGEENVRFYAQGMGETRSSNKLLYQAYLAVNNQLRLQVVRNMYSMRFQESIDESFSLQQIRGREGARMRQAYRKASDETRIPWYGRKYNRDNWFSADPVNRALSIANMCLYGICQAAIITVGLSPGIGFIHTGKQLSFVYDVADLYKTDLTIPIAFTTVKDGTKNLESRVRVNLRNKFREEKLITRIISDIEEMLTIKTNNGERLSLSNFNKFEEKLIADEALPGPLWDLEQSRTEGGLNYDY